MEATILVIDDVPETLQSIEAPLRRAGYFVHTASNDPQGANFERPSKPDLIILSTHDPDLDRQKICRQLRANSASPDAAVLILSDYMLEIDNRDVDLDFEIDGLLVRPIEACELLTHVRALLRLKAAERRLSEADDQMSSLIRTSPSAVISIDLEGRVVSWNPAAERILGWSEQEVLGKRIPYLPSGRSNELDIELEWIRQGHVLHDLHLIRLHRDGHEIEMEVSLSPLRDVTGKIIGALALINDLSSSGRTLAEQRLHTTNTLLTLFAHPYTQQEYLDAFVRGIHSSFGISRVGIRVLGADGSLPFKASIGLDQAFLDAENELTLAGNPCLCVRMITRPPHAPEETLLSSAGSVICSDLSALYHSFISEPRHSFRRTCMDDNVTFLALVPIRYSGQTVAMLHLADEKPQPTGDQLVHFVEELAPLVGEALHRFQIEAEMSQNIERQEIVNALLRLAVEPAPIQDILHQALDRILSLPDLPPHTSGGIYLVEGNPPALHIKALQVVGDLPPFLARVPLEECIISPHAHGISPQKCACALAMEEQAKPRSRPSISRCVPIQAGDVLLGVLHLELPAIRGRYSADVTSPGVVADTLALVISRRRSEEALRKSEEHLRLVVEHSPDQIFQQDRDLRYVWVPPSRLPTSAVDVVGKTDYDFFSFEESQRLEAIKRQVMQNRQPARVETKLIEAGRERFYDAFYEPWLNESGEELGITGYVRDITEHRQLEERLRQSQKMEVVGQLAGGVAHDFNNVLTAIIGYSEMVRHTVPADSPVLQDVEQVLRSARRAGTLTRQLLAFSRQQVLSPQTVDLNELVLDTAKMLRRLIGENVEMVELMEPQPCPVLVDVGQIEQILMNLVVNARDAMPAGGKLTLRTTRLTLDQDFVNDHPDTRVGPYVRLSVSDTGEGMSPDTLSHIFEPFFTTKPAGKGTGLGLATVYGIVKQHQGSIVVSSQIGKGSVFDLYFPCRENPVSQLPAYEHSASMPKGRETVLVVEDEPAVRALVTHALRSLGYIVLEASNGHEGLLVAQQYPDEIDLLLSDIIMPLMDGRTLAGQLLASRPGMQVLLMSGYSSEMINQESAPDLHPHFLPKPFSLSTLADAVRSALEPVDPPSSR